MDKSIVTLNLIQSPHFWNNGHSYSV